MVSAGNGVNKDEIQEELELSSNGKKLNDFIPVYAPTVGGGLIHKKRREKRFLDFLKARPSKEWFHKFGFSGRYAPFTFFRRKGNQRDAPPLDPSLVSGGRRQFRVPFVRKIKWEAVFKYIKKWLKHPKNIALLIWLLAVATGLILLLLVTIGALDELIPKKKQRKRWSEIINQVLNALFTIMCLYEHPNLFHQFVLLCRWKSKDRAELRKTYCKDGIGRRFERAHIMFVVILLHITCISQYVLCGLYWGYTGKNRPEDAELVCIIIGIAAPIIAFLYTFFGPLRWKIASDTDEESQAQAAVVDATQADQIALKVASGKVVVTRPEWIGGLFDCWDDMTVAYLSFFCTFCVFGWNMERLGFGNMYVHIATFILLCIAPFWVFNVSALNIHNDVVRETVGIIGIVLCVFGLLYGGFWRIQMRKKFKLPGYTFCCGYTAVADCMQWLFCWSCALAQEVRTGNFYDIEEDSFYSKESGDSTNPSSGSDESEGSSRPLPLPREGGLGPHIKPGLDSPVRSHSSPPKVGAAGELMIAVEAVRSQSFNGYAMTPPLPPLIQMEDKQQPPR